MPFGSAMGGSHVPIATKRTAVAIASADRTLVGRLATAISKSTDVSLVSASSSAQRSGVEARRGHISPDVLVLDVAALVADTSSTTHKRFTRAAPSSKVILIMDENNPVAVDLLLTTRALGCIPRDGDTNSLLRAVREVAKGELWLPRWALTKLYLRSFPFSVPYANTQATRDATGNPMLSLRESSALELARTGLTNKQIAQKLTISPSTVKKHLHAALEKLGLQRRRQLIG